ncbi:MAG: hypothetical protein IKL40_01155 [Clostridia bacterium]|nr:hypothetical protein [Clostridia bacterium]
MKKTFLVFILVFVMCAVFQGCGTKNEITDSSGPSEDFDITDNSHSSGDLDNKTPQNNISEEMAYTGVNNYCRSAYDWSVAEDNPDIMYVKMGEATESEYQVIFRSYTGTFVYFYVDKLSGITRLIEYVPNLDIKEEAGTIDLYDYLESDEK